MTGPELLAARATVRRRIAQLVLILQGDGPGHTDLFRKAVRLQIDHLRDAVAHAEARAKNGHHQHAFAILKDLT